MRKPSTKTKTATREDAGQTTSDEALLQEIRERFTYATTQLHQIRADADLNMQYVAGDPWDEDDRKQRKGRPTVAPDELHQYYNQVINDIRANPRGMQYSAEGDGANDAGARFYENKFREIEYRSHAQLAYITAAENAVQRSYGWVRVNTRYESDRSFNQEIWIEDIPNPDLVLPDPDAKRPDSSDMKWLFVFEPLPVAEFSRLHPDAKITDFAGYSEVAPLFVRGETIIRAEYWKIKHTKQTLLQFRDGTTAYESELAKMPAGVEVVKKRTVPVARVCQYLTNGVEILETNEWPGKYIPFVSCYGKVLYVKGQKQILSMTRHMREPWKLYCYYRSQQAEMAGMIPKTPVQAYEGQMRGHETDWARAMHEPVAYLQFKGTTPETGGTTVLPPPSRLDYHAGEHLQALELCAEGARRAIQAAAGSGFLPTQAQRKNEKSGIALQKIEQTAQRGSFHFVDHVNDLIRQTGVINEDLITPIYDTARDVGVREADGKAAIVRINDPNVPDSVSTKGRYLGTVSVGPSHDSEREAASDFADTIVSNGGFMEALGPQRAPKLLALAIKLRNVGPIGDQMAEIIDPQPKDGQAPDPQQLMAFVQAAKQENEQLKGALSEAVQALKSRIAEKQLELQAKKEIAALEATTRKEIAQINAESGLGQAAIKADSAETLALLEKQLTEIQAIVDGHQAALDRAHDVGLAAMAHAQTSAQAAQQHDQALTAGAVAHGQALDENDQAAQHARDAAVQQAALQPPTEGATA
jgi:hypothetical protein